MESYWEQIKRNHYLTAYDFNSQEESNYICDAVAEGVELFEKMFRYRSRSFVAPNFLWSTTFEEILFSGGVTLIQKQRNELIRVEQKRYLEVKFHYSGQENEIEQMYTLRNASFKPSSVVQKVWVRSCPIDISRAFLWRSPAIVAGHRVNFLGAFVPENRGRNSLLLRKLLKEMLHIWPDIEFMTTDELAKLW